MGERYTVARWHYAPLAQAYEPGPREEYATLASAQRAYTAARDLDGAHPDLLDNLTGDYLK